MKKALKWFAIFMGAMILLGFIALIFESDEDKAARELANKQEEIAAEQIKIEKLQAEKDKESAKQADVIAKEVEERDKKLAEQAAIEQAKTDKLQAEKNDSAAKEAEKQAKQVAKQAKTDERAKEKEKISDLRLYFACKPKIQEKLSNPRSFDPSPTTLEYAFVDNEHIIGFEFYAKNGFGGEVMHKAICSFDVDGKILEYGVVQ